MSTNIYSFIYKKFKNNKEGIKNMKFNFTYAGKEVVITDSDNQITIGSPANVIIKISKKDIYTQTKEQLFIVSEEVLKGHLKFLEDIRPSRSGIELEEINSMVRAIAELLRERIA
jgi:ATP/ADP translocase